MNPAIYLKRPFKTRNADEFDLSEILHLFVNPISGLTSPFDYENSIIKGRMGSGKTMYLRANHAYHLYGILPCLESQETITLPVLIRLSDFQHVTAPSEIYRAVVIKILEEMSSIYEHLQDVKALGRIHLGMKTLSIDPRFSTKMGQTLRTLISLGSDEYVEKLTEDIGLRASAKPSFFALSADYKKSKLTEIKSRPNAGIKDIEECYNNLFGDQNAKLLLLIDEAGALDKRFFRNNQDSTSFFEILMNQFRTAEFVRTKIALYPHSYSDILTETRYGDIVRLEEDIYQLTGYISLRSRTIEIIQNYINDGYSDQKINADELFDLTSNNNYGDGLEQLIYGSNGNIRRLIQLLDISLSAAYADHSGLGKVTLPHAVNALTSNSTAIEGGYSEADRQFLTSIIAVCKARSTFRFTFPSMSPVLSKYTMRSQEFNVITIADLGAGRRSTVYAFDYSFCVHHDLPTHYLKGSEKIDKSRSLASGEWISRVTTVSKDLIEHASIPGKIDGTLEYVKGDSAFVQGDDGKEYFVSRTYVIEDDQRKQFVIGKRLRFYPTSMDDSPIAVAIEIL